MIILAGVAINFATGENGIITRARNSKQQYTKEEIKEKLSLKIDDIQIEKQGNANLSDLDGLKLEGYDVSVRNIGRMLTVTKGLETYIFWIDSSLNITEFDGNISIDNSDNSNTTIREFTPIITEIKSHSFMINAETSSNETEIICYTYIVNGELKQSSKEQICALTNLNAETEYEIIVVAIDNLGNSKKSNTVKVKTRDEIVFTREYLEQGQTTGNTTITENNYNGTIGLSMTGNSNRPVGVGINNINSYTTHRWYKEIDITNYNALQFYSKKGQNHGYIYI